mgnify:CR=1 FL=1|tara:strand:+ start:118 stop:303 length:186 start_codon:yes stop_codon:yes gene_type:complete
MSNTKTYKVTFTVKTKSSPKDILGFIKHRIKDSLPVLSLNYELVEDRPTSVEHHGGVSSDE